MRYLNSNDVAEILGINISTLKRWTENGTIGCSKTAVATESLLCSM